ncbi:MAG: hypothetical protein KF813_09120 [Trueperaceae bacterium]|nr:hypothetical protein [Trueperaceae bacterium]
MDEREPTPGAPLLQLRLAEVAVVFVGVNEIGVFTPEELRGGGVIVPPDAEMTELISVPEQIVRYGYASSYFVEAEGQRRQIKVVYPEDLDTTEIPLRIADSLGRAPQNFVELCAKHNVQLRTLGINLQLIAKANPDLLDRHLDLNLKGRQASATSIGFTTSLAPFDVKFAFTVVRHKVSQEPAVLVASNYSIALEPESYGQTDSMIAALDRLALCVNDALEVIDAVLGS